MKSILQRVKNEIEPLGYSSLADLFIENPTFNFFSACEYLRQNGIPCVPAHLGNALQEECNKREDACFFARVALYNALTGFKNKGWSKQHWMVFGLWSGMLDRGAKEAASVGWDYLKGLDLSEGWLPLSIFDPILEEALKRGFGTSHVSS